MKHGPAPIPLDVPRMWEQYRRGLSLKRIAALHDCDPVTVYNRFKASGRVLRAPKQFWTACVDCGKDSGGFKRCPLHRRIERAAQVRDNQRTRRKTPESRWRA